MVISFALIAEVEFESQKVEFIPDMGEADAAFKIAFPREFRVAGQCREQIPDRGYEIVILAVHAASSRFHVKRISGINVRMLTPRYRARTSRSAIENDV